MKYTVEVTKTVQVELDPTKFTPEFLEEFRQSFYPFQTIEEHARYLAYVATMEGAEPGPAFIEGYGETEEFGITFVDEGTETTIIDTKE